MQHSKELTKRTTSDNILKDRAYEIARSRRYDGYQKVLPNMVYICFDKKTGPGAIPTSKTEVSKWTTSWRIA